MHWLQIQRAPEDKELSRHPFVSNREFIPQCQGPLLVDVAFPPLLRHRRYDFRQLEPIWLISSLVAGGSARVDGTPWLEQCDLFQAWTGSVRDDICQKKLQYLPKLSNAQDNALSGCQSEFCHFSSVARRIYNPCRWGSVVRHKKFDDTQRWEKVQSI